MAEWLYILNNQVREREGDGAVEATLSILRAGALASPGADTDTLVQILERAQKESGRPMADPELRSMASNLAVPDLTVVRVVNGENELIEEIPVANSPSAVPSEDRSENVHVDTEDDERPVYS